MKKQVVNNKWQLVIYDTIINILVVTLLLLFNGTIDNVSLPSYFAHLAISLITVTVARIVCKIYRQIWRYGGIQCYIRLLVSDALAFIVAFGLERILSVDKITFARWLAVFCINLLAALAMRMLYRYAYKCGDNKTLIGKIMHFALNVATGGKAEHMKKTTNQKIKIAIIGAGVTGISLAEELLTNPSAFYTPRCFIDIDPEMIGRIFHGLPVYGESEDIIRRLDDLEVQEIVFAIPSISAEHERDLYNKYLEMGYKLKKYDYPRMQTSGKKRQLREFDTEDLLFRKPIIIKSDRTNAYYKDKTVLITGGGGSIGSELCRQLAPMQPKQIIILDIYENGAYDIQQELKITYQNTIDIKIEICSITNKRGMQRVFETYHPNIVINAAAHKHVPLMETNCIEAIENNVFGTLNLVELCEEYGTERFMMVSTDKAVNPTNVMGATKRMCELITLSASAYGKTVYTATRFGNVLGSAGSVIPLFKKQIANGGPITITDKRIIRYFMTIPEASQLVLQSGEMAKNGELFVLDMGQPIKIMDLVESMIKISGFNDIEIIETGLRPGEKLYEELLVKTEELEKTDNNLIFIERDEPFTLDQIKEKLAILKSACETNDDNVAREALKKVVPTFVDPEIINAQAETAKEMSEAKVLQGV